MLKHIGRHKKSKRKVIVAFRTLPGDPYSCVCVTTENLESADHDSLINLVESNAGQTAFEFSEAMARTLLSDGSNMLARFHTTGKMVKFATNEIEMTPDTNNSVSLDELNQIIATQKGVSLDELSVKENQKLNDVENIQNVNQTKEVVQETITTNNEPLSDEQLAANYRSQADSMFKEAKRLREEAEKLVPIKKKTTQKSGEESK